MTEQDRYFIEVVHRFNSGDEAERGQIATDILWHVPAHNPVFGEYAGFDAYTRLMPTRMAPLTRWDFDLEDVMVNGHHVVTRLP